MTDIVIAGIAQMAVGEHWGRTLRGMGVEVALAAIQDAAGLKPQAMYVANTLGSTLSGQANLGSLLVDYAGLEGIEGTTVEAAGASGGAAVRMAYLAVASGVIDTALVVGVEKFTDQIGGSVEAALAETLDSDYESVHGITPTGQAALLMQRYLHEYGAPRQAFACFPIIAHTNAASNPCAYFRKAISPEAYANADLVSEPLNLYDVAPYADGAAALVITRAGRLPKGFPHRPVRISGSSVVTDTLALHDRQDPLWFHAAAFSVERACSQAGMMPKDADFFELADSTSIYAALSLETAGLARRGQGWQLAADGSLDLGGEMPISTLGGMKGRGNPLGAAGVYQVVEAVLQLRGQAGPNQVKGARRALVQALGGPASTAVTHVLESRE
jgi:acetyl-CoA C-acetyltransferase